MSKLEEKRTDQRGSVLVVESDHDFLQRMVDRLVSEGIEAIGASSAAEALVALERGKVQIVVMDIDLPDLDGLTFLRQAQTHNDCRLIVHGGCRSLETAKMAVNLNVFAYVEKKDEIEEVLSHIHRARATSGARYGSSEPPVTQQNAELMKYVERLVKLHEMVMRLHRCTGPNDVYDAAMDMVGTILGMDRCAILLFDSDGVMRFKAWRGLSASYRQAIEGHGHGPWHPHTVRAAPVLVSDVQAEPTLAFYRELFRQEGIGALAFIPLACSDEGRTLGKLMLYASAPRTWPEEHIRLAQVIADHVVAALLRIQAEELLRRSYQQREQFCLDLHDDILQSLYAVGLQLHVAKQDAGSIAPSVAASLEKAVGQLDGIIKDVRGVIEHVVNGRESVKEHADLIQVLDELIAGLESSTAGHIERRFIPANRISLPSKQVTQVLYIVKEALSNSLRHSHARRRWVSLRSRRSGLRLEIGDDGIGFDSASPTGHHIGLSSMALRAREVGGCLTVRTRPGRGTRVILDLP